MEQEDRRGTDPQRGDREGTASGMRFSGNGLVFESPENWGAALPYIPNPFLAAVVMMNVACPDADMFILQVSQNAKTSVISKWPESHLDVTETSWTICHAAPKMYGRWPDDRWLCICSRPPLAAFSILLQQAAVARYRACRTTIQSCFWCACPCSSENSRGPWLSPGSLRGFLLGPEQTNKQETHKQNFHGIVTGLSLHFREISWGFCLCVSLFAQEKSDT